MGARRTGGRGATGRFGLCLVLGASLLLSGAPGGTVPARAASSQDRLTVGLKAYRDGFHDLASKELRAFLAAAPADPRRPDVLRVLAQVEMARSDWKAARAVWEEVRALGGPSGREAGYWLAWVASRAGEGKEALALLDRYLGAKGGERRVDALFLAAELSEGVEPPARRAERYGAFLKGAPGDPRRAVAWAGRVSATRPAGAGAVRAAVGDALADAALRAEPEALEAVVLAGVEAARQQGDPAGEAGLWAALAAGAGDRQVRARALCEEGLARARVGEAPGARSALETCLREDPKGPLAVKAHLALSDVLRSAGDLAGALRHLEAALARPDDPAVKERLLEVRKAAMAVAVAAGDAAGAARHASQLLAREKELTAEERGVVRLTLAAAAGGIDQAVVHWDGVPPGATGYEEARLLAARALLGAARAREALDRLEPLLASEGVSGEVLLTALSAAEAVPDPVRAAGLCLRLAAGSPDGKDRAAFLERRARHLKDAGDEGAYVSSLESVAETRDPARAPGAASELVDRAFRSGDWEGVLRWAPLAREGGEPGRAAYQEAEALWALGRADEARAAFAAQADDAGPFRAAALARLGALLEAEGRRDEALLAYRRALEAGLDGSAADAVRARLDGAAAPGAGGPR